MEGGSVAPVCEQCKIEMVVTWEEPLGLVEICPACLQVIELHFERRKTERGVEGNQAA